MGVLDKGTAAPNSPVLLHDRHSRQFTSAVLIHQSMDVLNHLPTKLKHAEAISGAARSTIPQISTDMSSKIIELATQRMRLRPWQESDYAVFCQLHMDSDVSYWIGGPIAPDRLRLLFDRIRTSFETDQFGMFALLDPQDRIVGLAGLQRLSDDLPHAPAIEAAWRSFPWARGRGYITEAMRAVLEDGSVRLGLNHVVAITSESNLRSVRVMQRLGFIADESASFDHPHLAPGNPLRRHVLYHWRGAPIADARDIISEHSPQV
jgi:RimJ/RimL family protein N-acetyltransferase